ncbi:MAG TPA: hypothetical protein VFR90_15275 [Methylibium sp.]|uniref:hypothetical protein n=1 Tax=Methylibium sp. TaxID=2067992 RepID=UPI002DB7D4C5|nr:hypothetical protein [Methylibium sp.]HEU4460481.1 hypothetical protein [Methylibium sp.]
MGDRYIKTDLGRAEIQARVHAITRTARNLLLIIDGSRDGHEWVSMVRGCTAEDLSTLFEAGLIAQVGAAPPAPAAAPAPLDLRSGGNVPTMPAPLGAVSSLSYKELYVLLPSLAKEHLGLMKSYRFALAIEKADGLAGLQKVALDLVAEVEKHKGEGIARAVRRALLMG